MKKIKQRYWTIFHTPFSDKRRTSVHLNVSTKLSGLGLLIDTDPLQGPIRRILVIELKILFLNFWLVVEEKRN